MQNINKPPDSTVTIAPSVKNNAPQATAAPVQQPQAVVDSHYLRDLFVDFYPGSHALALPQASVRMSVADNTSLQVSVQHVLPQPFRAEPTLPGAYPLQDAQPEADAANEAPVPVLQASFNERVGVTIHTSSPTAPGATVSAPQAAAGLTFRASVAGATIDGQGVVTPDVSLKFVPSATWNNIVRPNLPALLSAPIDAAQTAGSWLYWTGQQALAASSMLPRFRLPAPSKAPAPVAVATAEDGQQQLSLDWLLQMARYAGYLPRLWSTAQQPQAQAKAPEPIPWPVMQSYRSFLADSVSGVGSDWQNLHQLFGAASVALPGAAGNLSLHGDSLAASVQLGHLQAGEAYLSGKGGFVWNKPDADARAFAVSGKLAVQAEYDRALPPIAAHSFAEAMQGGDPALMDLFAGLPKLQPQLTSLLLQAAAGAQVAADIDLHPGRHAIEGFGLEKLVPGSARLNLRVQPGTKMSLVSHGAIDHEPAQPAWQPQPGALARLGAWVGRGVVAVLRFVKNVLLFWRSPVAQPAASTTATAATATNSAPQVVRMHGMQLKSSKPLVIARTGVAPWIFQIRVQGASIDEQGHIIPDARLRLFNMPLIKVGRFFAGSALKMPMHVDAAPGVVTADLQPSAQAEPDAAMILGLHNLLRDALAQVSVVVQPKAVDLTLSRGAALAAPQTDIRLALAPQPIALTFRPNHWSDSEATLSGLQLQAFSVVHGQKAAQLFWQGDMQWLGAWPKSHALPRLQQLSVQQQLALSVSATAPMASFATDLAISTDARGYVGNVNGQWNRLSQANVLRASLPVALQPLLAVDGFQLQLKLRDAAAGAQTPSTGTTTPSMDDQSTASATPSTPATPTSSSGSSTLVAEAEKVLSSDRLSVFLTDLLAGDSLGVPV